MAESLISLLRRSELPKEKIDTKNNIIEKIINKKKINNFKKDVPVFFHKKSI